MGGFKIFPRHLKFEELDSLVQTPTVLKIVVRRVHVLEQFVSNEKAKRANTFARSNTSSMKVVVDPSSFIQYVARHTDYYNTCLEKLASNGAQAYDDSWLFLKYEDIKRSPVKSLGIVLKHLALPDIADHIVNQSLHFKQDERPVGESIANYEEFERELHRLHSLQANLSTTTTTEFIDFPEVTTTLMAPPPPPPPRSQRQKGRGRGRGASAALREERQRNAKKKFEPTVFENVFFKPANP